ncbi:hypothetical protein CWE12_12910 [Aliidiomarina sedimenti]|uniref:Uncharacterized protein n=1 Tax=Aliidiomarina sedimenti TaxID=1933879 RepID=A0ABY0BUY9_9GAMM|nr:hypothetical protein [Aliidiomarina sedimenti]RUO28115.1 hypothetical protein CWE12_12910 [Aliidiomarina sedimenti]
MTVIKMKEFIWPDKWIPFKVRFSLVIVGWVLWIVTGYLKYFIFDADGLFHVFGPILMVWIYPYLFNKKIYLSLTSAAFDEDDVGLQSARSGVFWISSIAFLAVIFIADW